MISPDQDLSMAGGPRPSGNRAERSVGARWARFVVVLALATAALAAVASWWGSPPEPPAVVLDSDGRVVHFPRLRDMVYLGSGQHQGLLIDRFEVTDGEYEEFARATAYDPEPRGSGGEPSRGGQRTFLRHWVSEDGVLRPVERNTPVRFVDRADSLAYARWRGKQLPTPDQWLLASNLMQLRRYPWIKPDVVESVCNTHEFGWNDVCPVGVFANGRSETNCFDLVGNVAEWTVGEHGSSRLARAMGGSFNTVLEPVGIGLDPVGSEFLPSDLTLGEPARFDLRNGELRDPGERAWDIGFRCVISQADRVIDGALDVVGGLPVPARLEALRELLAVGVYVKRRDRNRVLPFVSEREFLTRILWSIAVDQPPTLLRSPISLDDDPAEDLLVLVGDELQARSGKDGSLIRTLTWPEPVVNAKLVGGSEPGAWLWYERSNAELRIVDLTTFAELVFPPPSREPTASLEVEVRALPPGRGFLTIQSLEYAGLESDPFVAHLQHRRWGGEPDSIELPGEFKALTMLSEDTALVCMEEFFPFEIHEPFRSDGTKLDAVVTLSCSVVRLDPLRCIARHRFAPEPRRADEQVERSKAMTPDRPLFIGSTVPRDDTVLVAVAGQLSPLEEPMEVASEWFDLHLLGLPDLEVRDTARWTTAPGSSLLPSRLAGVWLGLDQGREPVVFEAVEGKIRRSDLDLSALSEDPSKREWWFEQDVSIAEPYLVDRFVSGGLEVRRLLRREGLWELDSLVPHRPERGLYKNRLLASAEGARMLFRHLLSDVYCVDPSTGEEVWQARMGTPAEGVELKAELFERGTDRGVLVGKKATDLWIRSLEDGGMIDHLQMRWPVDSYVLLDLVEDARREWVLEFAPGFADLLSLDGEGYRIVALRPPDADSLEHRLLLESRQVAEAQRERADLDRDP